MSLCRLFLGLVFGVFFSTSLASAILIETPSGPVGGYLLNDDGMTLKISIPTGDGQEKIGEYARDKVTIKHQLDYKLLESLTPDNPKAYHDYADKLAKQKADPEAQYTALRLYWLAAKLAPAEFGSSSLLSMSRLANTPEEDARKYRAMAFLLDSKGDADILKEDAGKSTQPVKFPARALEDFTKAMQSYRSGHAKAASEMARREGVDKIFSAAPGKIDAKTFLQWCSEANTNCPTCRMDGTVTCPTCEGRGVALNQLGRWERCPTCKGKKRSLCPDCGGTHVRVSISDDVVRVVLQCELWAMEQQDGGVPAGRKEEREAKSWSAIIQSRRLGRVLPLNLDTITSFPSNKCVYRNRKWVEE